MSPTRRTSLLAGVFYLVTFVSIPTLTLYADAKTRGFTTGLGSDSSAVLGAFLEVVVGLAGIGTAVTLYPVVRRYSEQLALGFVTARVLEAAMIFSGVAAIMTLVSLHRSGSGGTDSATLLVAGDALVGTYNWSFMLGQSLMPGLNALLLGTLLYRSGLVARVIPLIGLVGAPIHLTAVVLSFFGVIGQISTWTLLAALPIAAWEFSLGVYLVIKGLRTPSTERQAVDVHRPATPDLLPA